MKNFKKYAFILFSLILFGGCLSSNMDEDSITEETPEITQPLTLYLPHFMPANSVQIVQNIDKFQFKRVNEDDKEFLKLNLPNHWNLDYRWLPEINQGKTTKFSEKWLLSISDITRQVHIEGYLYSREGYIIQYELEGTIDESGQWGGTGFVSFGFDEKMDKETLRLFKTNWIIVPSTEEKKEFSEEFRTISLTRSPPASRLIPEKTEEEQQAEREFNSMVYKNNPAVRMNHLINAKREYPDNPLRRYGDSVDGKKAKRYIRDYIVPDLEWSELDALPSSIVLIDHLVAIEDKKVRETVAKVYAKQDNSWVPLMDQDLKGWTKVPLLFLLVHYTEWLTSERMEKLAGTTDRMRLLMEEIKTYGKDSPSHLDEIMGSVLSQMPEKERYDYFVKCIRLRNYVKESKDEKLRAMLPNELPPPPGPPENMRTWTVNDKPHEGAFVGVKDEILTLLDPDREEIRFFYSDISKTDKKYVESLQKNQAVEKKLAPNDD